MAALRPNWDSTFCQQIPRRQIPAGKSLKPKTDHCYNTAKLGAQSGVTDGAPGAG